MNELSDDTIKIFSTSSALSTKFGTSLRYRDSGCFIVSNCKALTFWYVSSEVGAWIDRSLESEYHKSLLNIAGLDFSPAISLPWVAFRNTADGVLFDSIALFPSGLVCSSDIRVYHVQRYERIIISVITEDNSLAVFAESTERSLFSDRAFHVVLCVHIDSIVSPSSVKILDGIETRGESIFVTDAGSDRVCEYRFGRSITATPRAIPTVTLAYWYLQSGIPIGAKTKVTYVQDDEGDVNVHIVGVDSNEDSQGIVKLVNFRDMSFSVPSWSCDFVVTESIEKISGFFFVNSRKSFKICRDSDLDFPVFIKPRVSRVQAVKVCDRIILIALNDGMIRFFEFDKKNEELIAPDWDPLYDIGLFDTCICGDGFYLGYFDFRSKEFIVISLDVSSGKACKIHSRLCADSVKTLSIKAPLNEGDPMQFALLSEKSGTLLIDFNFESEAAFLTNILDVKFTGEYLCILKHGNMLLIYSLYNKALSEITLPRICGVGTRIKTVRKNESLFILIDSIIVERNFDFYAGISWTLQDLKLSGIVEMDDENFQLTVLNYGNINTKIPSFQPAKRTLYYIFPLLRRCVSQPLSANLEILSDGLRSELLRLFQETERTCDSNAKRFLIEYLFSREYPNIVAISAEAIAFAALSETPEAILGRVIPTSLAAASGLEWNLIKNIGLVFWFSDSPKLKEIAEAIQKSALQEYMKSKDPNILDSKLALWLSILGKQALLASLYKQHGNSCASPVHLKIAQFLSIDFSDPENRSKGTKNAFELVRQKRYSMAVAVFLFSCSYRDAVDICCRQMEDIQLGLMILKLLKARIATNRDDSLDSISDYVWESRIVQPCLERGDPFFSLVFAWTKQDMSLVKTPSSGLIDSPQLNKTGITGIGPFTFRKSQLCKFAIYEFLCKFSEKLKRYNKPTIPVQSVTAELRAIELFETGCADLAKSLEGFDCFHPSLKFAIDTQLCFSQE